MAKKILLIIFLLLFCITSVYAGNRRYICQTLAYSATKSLSPPVRGDSYYFINSVTGNISFSVNGGVQGDGCIFFLTSDAGGGDVMTFSTGFTSAGTMTLIASQTSIIRFTYTGSTWKEEYRINGNSGSLPTSVQGDTLYASAANTWSVLAKDANATRYLSNTGANNNPAWAQVALATGVSGTLPSANGGTPATRTIELYRSTYKPSPDGTSNSGILSDIYDITNYVNFTRWTSGSATQDYNIWYEFTIPSDFVSFPTNAFSINVRSNDFAGNTLTATFYDSGNAVDTGISAVSIAPSQSDVWQTKTDTPDTPTTPYAAGQVCHIKIFMLNDEASNTVDIARLFLTYNTR